MSRDRTPNQVVADSSFYLLFYADLNDRASLHRIAREYDFFVGERIRYEIRNHITNDNVIGSLLNNVEHNIDFSRILKDFYSFLRRQFPQYSNWIDDGEFEAMGISYQLSRWGLLKYLIMDDKDARTFVESHLSTVGRALVRTPSFLHKTCKNDNRLSSEFVVSIMMRIVEAIRMGKRPLNLTEENWEKYIKPLINDLTEDNGGTP